MNRLAISLACLGLSMWAHQAALAQQSQPSDPQKEDVAQLRKELQDLKAMLQEQRRAHEAEMKELRQQFAGLAATQKAVAASQPVKPPATAADDLAAAIQEAQGEATPPEKGKPAAPGGNWFGLLNQSAPIQSFNPDISLVGDFQARHDSDKGGVLSDKRFVKEVELGISGNVDPYARFNSVFSKVLLTRRSQFLHKISTLTELVEELAANFLASSEEILAGDSLDSDSEWDVLDASHYDLNTCLRETVVLFKSFLHALPESQLQEFLATFQERTACAEGLLPAKARYLVHRRMAAIKGQ